MQAVYHRSSHVMCGSGGRFLGGMQWFRRAGMVLTLALGGLGGTVPAWADSGFVGLEVQGAEGPAREALGKKGFGGVLVRGVLPHGPADAAGIRPADLLLTFDDVALSGLQQLVGYMGGAQEGQEITFNVWRKGRQEEVTVALGDWPPGWRIGAEATAIVPRLGVTLRAATAAVRRELRLPWGTVGVVIANVEADSPAARAGLRPGEVIVAVGRQRVTAPGAVEGLLKAQGEAPWMLLVDDGTRLRLVGPGAPAPEEIVAGAGVLAAPLSDGPYVLAVTSEGPAVSPGDTLPAMPAPRILPDPAQEQIAGLGLTVANLSAEARAVWPVRWSSQGVVITAVESGSPAFGAVLAPGQVIRHVNQTLVRDAGHLVALLKAASQTHVLLTVEAGGARRLVALRRDGQGGAAPAVTPVFQFGKPG